MAAQSVSLSPFHHPYRHVASFRFLVALRQLSGHRWLRAIRNSLVLLLPVTFVGAMAVLLGSFPLAALSPQMHAALGGGGARLASLATLVGQASNGILAIFVVILVSHSLALESRQGKHLELSPPVVATVALINFFIFLQRSEPVGGQLLMGSHSILAAILVAIFSAEVFAYGLRFQHERLGQHSYDLDPNLHLAVRAIAPALLTVILFLLALKVLSLLTFDLSQWLGANVLSLNESWNSQLPGLFVLSVLNQGLWFLGIHGPHVLDSLYRLVFEGQTGAGQLIEISRETYNLYVHLGGSGSTLGLLLVILLQVRAGEARRVAKFALLPALFNINELVIFGLPIVLNPVYLIPFVLAPVVQVVVSYFCVRYGLLAVDVASVPWMTPPVLGGTLNSGSWHGGALQLFNLLLSALIYLPFVRLAEQRRQSESLTTVQRAVSDIALIKQQQISVLDRHDDLGHTARKLLHEFMQDIDSSQVFLAYQPQHDRDGRVVGVEALLRWEHRHFGFISPAVICALAEESQQIIPLGRWIIASACRQLHEWEEDGIEQQRISVNLSPLQLKDETLLAFIEECLQANRLPPSALGLELTESQHVPDDPVSSRTLLGLQSMGIHLEMDDFGMGYSSMLYVRRFKFSAIKLDGSLTKEVLQDNNCSDIISSVVQLGRALGIRVIAEYVETLEQQARLEQLGCEVFQGYLYSPALASGPCLAYLHRHQRLAGRADVADAHEPAAIPA